MVKRAEPQAIDSAYVTRCSSSIGCAAVGCKAPPVASVMVGGGWECEADDFCLEHLREVRDDISGAVLQIESD